MDKRIGSALCCAAIGLAATAAGGQEVIERDTKVTGPRGRTTERDIRVRRGPGYIDRQVEVKRPGETIIRDTRISTGPAGRPYGGRPYGGPGYGPGPRFYGGRPIVEEVFVPGPPVYAPVVAPFVALPGFSFFFGGGQPAPPPPVVAADPGPGYPPPPAGPPPQQVIDPLTEPLARLKSLHGNSRRDACLAIGSLHDPRAVPSLVERLEHDFDKEVRVAAAWGLGEIGDPRAAVPLERAAQFDKRADVRGAAKTAYEKLPKPGQVVMESPATIRPESHTQVAPAPSRAEVYDPGPSPRPAGDDLPPPYPTPAGTPNPSPATGPSLEPPRS